MRTDKDVMVPLSDGVHLATDLYMPEDPGVGPWPVILVRSPYDKNMGLMNFELMTSDGFVVALQDVRGRFKSEGDFLPLENERRDGAEVIAWLREQEWCNGHVATASGSYLGATQWLSALEQPEGLIAAVPQITGSLFDGFCFYARGIVQMDIFILWNASHIDEENRRREISISDAHAELKALRAVGSQVLPMMIQAFAADPSTDEGKHLLQELTSMTAELNTRSHAYLALPLSEQLAQLEPYAPWIRRFVDNLEDPGSAYWEPFDWSRHYDTISIPMYHQAGWHDLFIRGSIRDYTALTARADIPFQKLVVGPEYHASSMMPGDEFMVGEKLFKSPVVMDHYMMGRMPDTGSGELYRRWFLHWLKGEDTGLMDEAPVTLFVQGDDVWRDEQEWPLARTKYTPLYLNSDRGANSIFGDGTLRFEAPAAENGTDSYHYDPADPVPSQGGTFLNIGIAPGMFDQADVEKRQDVLVYSTVPLEKDLEVTGPVVLKLWAATSAVDTDFTARLVDVDASGRALGVCDGVVRLRFRKDHPGPAKPGEIQELDIELSPTSYVFKAGHIMRVQVSSSNYPLFEMNPNTGKSLFNDPSNEMVVAEQTVYHNAAYPSHLILPVIPGD